MRLRRLSAAVAFPAVALVAALVPASVATPVPASASAAAPAHVEGVLPSGATYVFDVPSPWNGTVLLYSHGYTPRGAPNPARNAPADATRDVLLADGYALIGSSYADTGWVLEQALPDQIATLDVFAARYGRARRAAQATPLGRARTALAAALHNLPAWSDPAQPEPAPDDYDTAVSNQARALATTIYVGLSWRQEAESRAGGSMSWNSGVDYGRLLARSSIRAEVRALYAAAGAPLDADLAALAAAPRITADPPAVTYLARHLSFTGRLHDPLLTIHTTGDALVPVQVQSAYRGAVDRPPLLRQSFVHRAGHCTFTTGEMLAALRTVERRLTTGRWSGTSPGALNALAARLDPAATPAYAHYVPAPYPRPWENR
jgi:hypothetical protein